MWPVRIGALCLLAGSAYGGAVLLGRNDPPLPTGKWISPEGFQAEVGSFPANMLLAPNGRYAVVTNTGYRQFLTVVNSDTGDRVSQLDFNGGRALYYGLAFADRGEKARLFVSRGFQDKISVYDLEENGTLTPVKELDNPAPKSAKMPHHIAGLATNSDGTRVYAVNNQTAKTTDLHGSVSVIDVASNTVVREMAVGGFPFGVASLTKGKWADQRIFVTNERDDMVTVLNPTTGDTLAQIRTGSIPLYVKLNADQSRLFVGNANSDTVSVIDTDTLTVVKTILVRPAAFRGLPGSTPLGMDLSPDEKTLYVAMADLNAVAVVDVEKGELKGYLPAGWYPTSVVVSQGGDRLLVANAKGVKVRNPNGSGVRKYPASQYGPSILEGTVASLDLSQELGRLDQHTERVMQNNRATNEDVIRLRKEFRNPGIQHVVYVIKENRTYDQVLGDLTRGNGNPSLTLFGRRYTPNQHALVERFALLDDFYVCAEVSADGWNWSTAGMANEYTQRNTFTNYSGRGRSYDFEGTNNDIAPDMQGLRDVATPDGGYLWDSVAKRGLSLRNFGMFSEYDEGPRPDDRMLPGDGAATKRALKDVTSLTFRRYDMAYADSEAWVKYQLPKAPRQLAAFGKFNDPSRITAWKREFAEMVQTKKMPNLMLVRLGRDHTSGTTPGQPAPGACVADNDYAVGQLVEEISKSPFWKSTAIFVVEDDAQAGFDHVDSHRSTGYVISPFVPKGTYDSTFYNTDSMLNTICLLLGVEPMNHYVATATPFRFFSRRPTNAAPYTAILPDREVVAEVNRPTAYRAKDSARLINRFQEESLPDLELNDILWGAMKGSDAARPQTPGHRYALRDSDD